MTSMTNANVAPLVRPRKLLQVFRRSRWATVDITSKPVPTQTGSGQIKNGDGGVAVASTAS